MENGQVAPVRVLGIAGSPRRNGNSEILLDLALGAAGAAGADVDKIVLSSLSIGWCRGCDACASGRCVQRDDMDRLYPLLDGVDALILAAPVYFYGLPAQAKSLVDRGQLFWHRKYGEGPKAAAVSPLRRGALIAVGATHGKQLFVGTRLTVRNWFDSLDIEYTTELLVNGMDARGEVRGDEAALRSAANIGTVMAAGGQAPAGGAPHA